MTTPAARALERDKAEKLMRQLGAVPIRWELDGEVWVEEAYTDGDAYDVHGCLPGTFDFVAPVRTDAAGIVTAVRSVRAQLAVKRMARASGDTVP